MYRVTIALDPSSQEGAVNGGNNAVERDVEPYDGWVPVAYSAAQLRQDATRFFRITKPSKYELLDACGQPIADETLLESIPSTIYTLRKIAHQRQVCDSPTDWASQRDPFWLQEALFEVFLLHSLPTWNGRGALGMPCYQFKQLISRSLDGSKAVGGKISSHGLTVRVTLAFKAAVSQCNNVGATFNEFLDVLVDVAAFILSATTDRTKEKVLERFTMEHIVPYYTRLQANTVNAALTWPQMDDLLLRKKVKALLQRFTQPLAGIARTFSTSATGLKHQRGLRFNEFSRFIQGVKPSSISITAQDLCFIFVRCCRRELGSATAKTSFMKCGKEQEPTYARLTSDDLESLELSSSQAALVIAYVALIAIPRLSRGGKNHTVVATATQSRVSTKLGVHCIKALLHQISMTLASIDHQDRISGASSARSRFPTQKPEATLPHVSMGFKQEFQRLHRQDGLEDYLQPCSQWITTELYPPNRASMSRNDERKNSANLPENIETTEPEDDQPLVKDDDELNLEINWGDGDSCESENEDDASPHREISADQRLERERLEEQELMEMVNDADEIYTFLTAELQRHSADRRLKDDDVVPQILDIWVTAGQKYAQVIKYVDSKLQESPSEQRRRQKTTILERFGSSLYVFAMQLLKSTTTIFKYEELFHFTNGRVFKHMKGDLWNGFDESATTFAADLAIESLSLASGKLGLACQELQTLYHTEQQSESLNELLGSEYSDTSTPPRSTAERYYACLLQRANCLDAYGDVLAHGSHVVDYDLGWALEDEQEHDAPSSGSGYRLYVSDAKLTKHSTPGRFYHEAQRIYRYLLTMSSKASAPPSNGWITKLHWYLAKTEFKVATHIPRRCLAEKRLLDNATAHLKKHSHHCQLQSPDEHDQSQQRLEYLRSVVVVREKFFQPETDKPQDDIESSSSTDSSIVPLYRFVLAAVFRDFDNHKLGMLTQEQLTRLNELCGQSPVTDSVMAWLLNNFDNQDSLGLTEKGMLQYLCWLAEANPPAFCDILDILTEKYTETQASISSATGSSQERRPTSLRRPVMSPRRQYSSTELGSPSPPPKNCASGIAQCIVILTGKIIQDASGDISQTRTPSEVRLEPVVVDCLPPSAVIPDELSKFCFSDEIFMSSEPLPPKTLDIVLTDITGARHFGTCFHFYEEKDPIDVLALISNSQRGEVSASLPSWISLKDIQQRNIPWRCFIPKCVCILSSAPLFQTFRDCLAHLYRLSISLPPYPVEAFLHDILERIPLPTSGHTVTCFNLGDKSILLSGCPIGSSPFHAKQTDFTLLFQCLSAENILKVYSYVMTEKKIILCARNASILTPVAETLRALLFPFECQVVYIPLLPLSLLDFVTAPVPFFMGIRSDHSVSRLTSEGVIVVDLDRDEIAIPQNETFPVLPETKVKKLLQSLRKASAWAGNQGTKAEYGRFHAGELSEIVSFTASDPSSHTMGQILRESDDLQEKWVEIHSVFSSFAMKLARGIRKHCVSRPSSDGTPEVSFDSKSYLAIHPNHREFCSHLFQTQLFQRFIEQTASQSEPLQLAGEFDQGRRNMRALSIINRRSDTISDENVKPHPRQITKVPPLIASYPRPSSPPTHRRRHSGRQILDTVGPFNALVYEGLCTKEHQKRSPNAVLNSAIAYSPYVQNARQASFSTSPSPSMLYSAGEGESSPPDDVAPSNLVMAARLRLELPTRANY